MTQSEETGMSDDFSSLKAVGATYTKASPQDRVIRGLIVRTFEPFLNASMRGLQLGYAEGVDTGLLAPHLARLDVVEGNRDFYESGRRNGPDNTRFHHALFEDFLPRQPEAAYDAIFLIYVLEHVVEPVALLKMAKRLLSPGGRLFLVVPNARALSRQLALHMGLIPDLFSLTPHDLEHGHRRVYDRTSFDRDIESASLRVEMQGGIMLKILADFQIDTLIEQKILGPEQIDGLYKLGFDYPDLCGSLYAICSS